MARVVRFVLFVCVNYVRCVPPSPTTAVTDMLQVELGTLKNTMRVLSDQWEKWNTLFITSLEPRITSTASTLASIDSNIHNLQERAHVWDTFQLHVSAWNDQLASLDRKLDIISKCQEKVLFLEGKINGMLGIEYKLDNAMKVLNDIYDSVTNLDSTVHTKKNHDTLLSEFATRGVLSSIKMVEKKLDRLLITTQSSTTKGKGPDEKPKFTIKCNTPRIIEDLLNDISSKVDVIFDSISTNNDDEDDTDYDNDYLEVKDGSGEAAEYKQQTKSQRLKKVIRRASTPCRQMNQVLEEVLNRVIRIENTSLIALDKENTHFEKLYMEPNKNSESKVLQYVRDYATEFVRNTNLILGSYFSEQRSQFESIFNKLNKKCYDFKLNHGISIQKHITTTSSSVSQRVHSFDQNGAAVTGVNVGNTTATPFETSHREQNKPQPTWIPIVNQNKSSCEDLIDYDVSGVYIFENNIKGRDTELFFNKRYCEIRNDGLWTVIQRRDNYTLQHNFNASWEDYKYGFGNLHRDFWIGNDFLYKTSRAQNLVLRIELEDFEHNFVWAEYDTFAIASERDNYKLTVGGYTGNASDSFSGHNGSSFSTYDNTNDLAPKCCPCSASYGGGWWFNRCFESNLNGIYFKKPHENNYFRGIIWEHWLGNYSLKKSVMMIKPRMTRYENASTSEIPSTETIPYYEDP